MESELEGRLDKVSHVEGNQKVPEALLGHEWEHEYKCNCVNSLVCNATDPVVEFERGL